MSTQGYTGNILYVNIAGAALSFEYLLNALLLALPFFLTTGDCKAVTFTSSTPGEGGRQGPKCASNILIRISISKRWNSDSAGFRQGATVRGCRAQTWTTRLRGSSQEQATQDQGWHLKAGYHPMRHGWPQTFPYCPRSFDIK